MTARTAALAVPNIATLFSTPKVKKAKLTSVKVDNQGAVARTIHLRDDFTTDVSAGAAVAADKEIERLQITVGTGLTADVPETELKDVEFLGDCKCYADVAEPLCIIIVGYHME
ncbi:hypothetical protein ES703_41188 [subsurface metagenome]